MTIKTIISDFSRVLLFPKNEGYERGLNSLYDALIGKGEYTFADHFVFNEPLLQYLEGIKEKYGLYIFTTGHIQDQPEIRKRTAPIFKAVYSAEGIPFGKNHPEGYRYILEVLRCQPEETLYIDDSYSNIETARRAGLHTVLFRDNEQLFQDFQNFGI